MFIFIQKGKENLKKEKYISTHVKAQIITLAGGPLPWFHRKSHHNLEPARIETTIITVIKK